MRLLRVDGSVGWFTPVWVWFWWHLCRFILFVVPLFLNRAEKIKKKRQKEIIKGSKEDSEFSEAWMDSLIIIVKKRNACAYVAWVSEDGIVHM